MGTFCSKKFWTLMINNKKAIFCERVSKQFTSDISRKSKLGAHDMDQSESIAGPCRGHPVFTAASALATVATG
eukprot:scaffold120352_cov48-Cyclotella_meneghiniana.AAC.1